MEIELYYFDGCPSYRRAWNTILDVLVELKIAARVTPVPIDDADTAKRLHFAGSPSISIDGIDLEDRVGSGTMACRMYAENDSKGWPSKNLIMRRAREAAEPSRG